MVAKRHHSPATRVAADAAVGIVAWRYDSGADAWQPTIANSPPPTADQQRAYDNTTTQRTTIRMSDDKSRRSPGTTTRNDAEARAIMANRSRITHYPHTRTTEYTPKCARPADATYTVAHNVARTRKKPCTAHDPPTNR